MLECAARRVNYLYGWAGVAYRPGVLEGTSLMDHLGWLDGPCWSCDDQFVAGHVITRNLPIYVVPFPVGNGSVWTGRKGAAMRAARPNASKHLSKELMQHMSDMLSRFKLKTWQETPAVLDEMHVEPTGRCAPVASSRKTV